MNTPLMPKATAVWLVDNTALSFEQIAEFCDLHVLEVKGIADGDVASGIVGLSPLQNNQLDRGEIERCEKDAEARLQLKISTVPLPAKRSKGPRYTPIARRQEKPDAIAFLVKTFPDLKDSQIIKLIGTTKNTIGTIRNRNHWNMANITPRDPVLLGLCKQQDLDREVAKVSDGKTATELKAEAEAANQVTQSADSLAADALAFANKSKPDDSAPYAIPEALFKLAETNRDVSDN